MNNITKHSFIVVAAVLLLTSCGNKPFGKVASIQEKITDKVLENPITMDQNLSDHEMQMEEELEPLRKELLEVAKASVGTEIETVSDGDLGFTLEENLTIVGLKEKSHNGFGYEEEEITLKLRAKVKTHGEDHPGSFGAIGYDGNSPALLLNKACFVENDYGNDVVVIYIYTDKLAYSKALGRINRIVLTKDKELIKTMDDEKYNLEMELMKKYYPEELIRRGR